MVDPRRPEYDPLRPTRPGPIERDLADPAARLDPYSDPRIAGPRRGIAGATLAVAAVLLAVLAFAFFGGGTSDQASAPPPAGVVEGGDNTATGSINPNETPAEPQPAPAPAPVQ